MTERETTVSAQTVRLARRLWALTFLRGTVYLAVGVLLFVNPVTGLTWLTWLAAIFAGVQGVILLVEAWNARGADGNGALWRWVVGGLGLVVAVVIAGWPASSGLVLLRVLGVWALVAGAVGVVGALRARTLRTPGWDWQLTNALLWIVFGVVVLLRPVSDLETIALLLGLYLVVSGIILLVAAFSMRTVAKDTRAEAATSDPVAPGPGPATP